MGTGETTMVERVARAMGKVLADDAGGCFATPDKGDFCDDTQCACRELEAALARAAIEAMREPTPEMMKAAAETDGMRAVDAMIALQAVRGYPLRTSQDGGKKTILEMAWEAAIDAALSEGS